MSGRVYGSMSRIVARTRPNLQPLSNYVGCVCGTRFQAPTARGRNCHMCGEAYCFDCTRKSLPLPHLNYIHPVTVCDTCYVLQQMASMPRHDLRKLPIKWLLFYVHAFGISIEGDVEKESIVEKIEKTPIDENMVRNYWRYPSYYDGRRDAFLPKPPRRREAQNTTSRRSSMEQDGFFGFFLNPFDLFHQGIEWATDVFGSMDQVEPQTREERPQHQQQRTSAATRSRSSTSTTTRSSTSTTTRSSPSTTAPPSFQHTNQMPKEVQKNFSQRPLTIEELVKRGTNVQDLSVNTLKAILNYNAVEHRNLVEKSDLITLVRRLCDEYRTNMERISKGETPKDSDICKICFDQQINCVLLECGHMASCIECARQLFECPICREPILRIVHTFKA